MYNTVIEHSSAVAKRNQGGRAPLATACAPRFWFTLFFLEHTQDFLGRRRLCNQRQVAKEPSTSFSQII